MSIMFHQLDLSFDKIGGITMEFRLHQINIEIRNLTTNLALFKMFGFDEGVTEATENLKALESEKANLEAMGITDTAEWVTINNRPERVENVENNKVERIRPRVRIM